MAICANSTPAPAPRPALTPSRFHNMSDAALADEIGRVDAIAKAAAAELETLKAEAKHRGVEQLIGDKFEISVTEQIAGRLDTKKVKDLLGERYSAFEKAVISTVVRVKAINRLAIAA